MNLLFGYHSFVELHVSRDIFLYISTCPMCLQLCVSYLCFCCFACSKFYFKPRRNKKKKEKEGKANDEETGSKPDKNSSDSSSPPKYSGNTSSSPTLKYPGTTKYPHYDFNKGVNFAYDVSSDMEKEAEVKAASHSVSNGGYSTYSTSVYQEQYSTDSGTSISDIMEYPHNLRYSGSSDSEGNRSVR